ncbi:hypothetical protein FHU41_000397 [Psychromicrobium silvestre]|uniref:Uncharacterized protein n=1 Tax=Psychromicrobium silvestre TaxID=1645614 RepID=A0A7Y9S5R0_9MICC|nr:hypothetical protein [Psychromicrobium silvestre]NYE94176.1 hypothetical protein [Psychromicrobium silvestre]
MSGHLKIGSADLEAASAALAAVDEELSAIPAAPSGSFGDAMVSGAVETGSGDWAKSLDGIDGSLSALAVAVLNAKDEFATADSGLSGQLEGSR